MPGTLTIVAFVELLLLFSGKVSRCDVSPQTRRGEELAELVPRPKVSSSEELSVQSGISMSASTRGQLSLLSSGNEIMFTIVALDIFECLIRAGNGPNTILPILCIYSQSVLKSESIINQEKFYRSSLYHTTSAPPPLQDGRHWRENRDMEH